MYIELIIKTALAVALAILFGNGVVVMFNRIPVRWFEEDGTIPEELMDAGDGARQRLTSTPWKYVFTGLFLVVGIFIAVNNSIQFETASLCVLAIVLMMAICDARYMIVPDQFQLLLAVSAIGYVGFYEAWWEQIAGAGIGLALNLAIYTLGRLIYRKDTIGGADIKFFACIGLIAGRAGVVWIFVVTVFCQGMHAVYLVLTRQAKPGEARAMLPYAFVGVLVYFVFICNMQVVLTL